MRFAILIESRDGSRRRRTYYTGIEESAGRAQLARTITRISSRSVVLLHMPRIGAALADHDTFRRLGLD